MAIESALVQWERLRQLNPVVPDGLMAALLLVVAVAVVYLGPVAPGATRPTGALPIALLTASCTALTVRRRWPLAVLIATCSAAAASDLAGFPSKTGIGIPPLLAAYTLATVASRQRVVIVAGFTGAFLLLLPWAAPNRDLDLGEAFGTWLLFIVALAVGDGVRLRRAYLEQLELRARDLERSQAEQTARAVTDERLRIARELHDVVAHAMSVVAVQSGVGAHVVDQRPDQARAILENINTASRDALDEMRRLVGVLRPDGSGHPGEGAGAPPPERERLPAPTLADVGELTSRIEAAGVTVRVAVEGERRGLPAGIDLSAYRVVQEALTNVLKHAGPASVDVHVRYASDRVQVEVTDDGRGAAAASSRGGHGLVGMRERVALYGGTLETGPRAGGGFRVVATLPFDPGTGPSGRGSGGAGRP